MTYSFTDKAVSFNFNLTNYIGPGCENMEEDEGIIEFNNRSDEEKFKLLEKLNE